MIFLGWRNNTVHSIINDTRKLCYQYCSELPRAGWDWTELQERVLQSHRRRDKASLSQADIESMYEQELIIKDQRIEELQNKVDALSGEITSQSVDEKSFGILDLASNLDSEIYEGEFRDRINYLAEVASQYTDAIGIDSRTMWFIKEIMKNKKATPGLIELRKEIEKSTRDGGKLSTQVPTLLSRYGFEKSDKDRSHINLRPKKSDVGLEGLTVPKTPSDHRASKNLRSEIENKLGIRKLNK